MHAVRCTTYLQVRQPVLTLGALARVWILAVEDMDIALISRTSPVLSPCAMEHFAGIFAAM